MFDLIRKRLALIIILSFPLIVSGQYRFDVWTAENGLPQNTVNGIVQADDGFLWLTTNDGIVRFDGVRFKVFNKLNTKKLLTSRFGFIFKDETKRLWFRSEKDNLVMYENRNFKTFTLENGLPAKGINNLSDDGQGGILFTNDKGHFRYSGGEFLPIEIKSIRPDSAVSYYDRGGGIWLNDEAGLRRVVGDEVTNYQIKTDFETIIDFYPKNIQIFEDTTGSIWVEFPNQPIYRIYKNKVQELPITADNFISKFAEDKKGNLWISFGEKIVRVSAAGVNSDVVLNEEIKIFGKDEGFAFGDILSLASGREGSIWVGTFANGLIQITPQDIKVFSGKDWNSPDENVYPIYEDSEENVWLGVWEKTLVKYSNGTFKTFRDSENTNLITSLFEDSENNLLIGTTDVYQFKNGKSVKADILPNFNFRRRIFTLDKDRQNNLWIGTREEGFFVSKDGKSRNFTTEDGLPSNQITAFLELKDGTICVGTYDGFAFYKDSKWTSHKGFYVRSLYEDKEGILWIGTYDSGLIRFDGKYHFITPENGLYSKNVFCILEDDNGWFWMNSNTGIYRVLRQQLKDFTDGKINRVTSIAYTTKDGLLSAEGNGGKQPAGIKRRNGELWFPTQKGVAVVKPWEVIINNLPPPVHFEEILIDGEDIGKYTDKVVLEPGQQSIEVNYTGLSFINPELVKFRYRLEGLDEKWIEAGTRRFAFFTNLRPGNYTFELQAANRDGVWNRAGKSLKIIVQPHFYQTWWFTALVIISLIGLILLVYFYQVSHLKRFASAREAFAEKLIESQETERKRVAAELHDGIGQTLAMINNRAVFISQDLGDPEDRDKQFEILTEQTLQAISEVREISFNLRPYLLERLGLTKALRSLAVKTADANKLDLIKQIDDVDNLFPPKAEMSIYRIVQESLSNILKHAEADEIVVKVERKQSVMHIVVQDNGKGFDVNSPLKKEGGSGGFGFISLSERVRMLGGDYTIESEIGKGTKVIVSIGLKNSE